MWSTSASWIAAFTCRMRQVRDFVPVTPSTSIWPLSGSRTPILRSSRRLPSPPPQATAVSDRTTSVIAAATTRSAHRLKRRPWPPRAGASAVDGDRVAQRRQQPVDRMVVANRGAHVALVAERAAGRHLHP